MNVLIILAGALLLVAAFTDRLAVFAQRADGYPEIPLEKFLLALLATSLPLAVIDRDDHANAYIGLMLLAVLIFNARAVEQLAKDVQR